MSAESSFSSATPTSWLPIDRDSPFSIINLPYGVFKLSGSSECHIGVAIGENALDLNVLASAGLFDSTKHLDRGKVFLQPTLNAFMALPRLAWTEAREFLLHLLLSSTSLLRDDLTLRAKAVVPNASLQMQLPAAIGDYTDFYSSRYHAFNVGVMFRGADKALQPNWLHLPVGYHGRSSSVVCSGSNVRRPRGQLQLDPEEVKPPVFGECRNLDFELEFGVFVGGKENEMGKSISIEEAEDRLFGCVLLNDWSARDIQKWEYVPLGPFTAKNFCTTISPWIVTFDALKQFRAEPPKQTEPSPLPYLLPKTNSTQSGLNLYDIELIVELQPESMAKPQVISRSNTKYLYWTAEQQLVHHAVTGCNMRAGDLLGSGTISGPEPHEYGSMLELAWKGTKPISIEDGTVRRFLQDGDQINITGWTKRDKNGNRIGFGDCKGKILPAL